MNEHLRFQKVHIWERSNWEFDDLSHCNRDTRRGGLNTKRDERIFVSSICPIGIWHGGMKESLFRQLVQSEIWLAKTARFPFRSSAGRR